MGLFITLIILVAILYFINSNSDKKNGITGKSIKETIFEPKEVGLGNSIVMWLVAAVGICFILWILGLGPS
jgi:predicted membrane protein